jgi:hypothetical protein
VTTLPVADEATVRQFITIISEHAVSIINGKDPPGLLQLFRISPIDESMVASRFIIDDVEHMLARALGDANAGHNVYIEARTVRSGLPPKRRGDIADTIWVTGLVIDSDADKGMIAQVNIPPTMIVETSPGNAHLWYLLDQVIEPGPARVIGELMRRSSGGDKDTGVITQCYRVAGTPNFPSASKRHRGRTAIELTSIVDYNGRFWDPEELLRAFTVIAPGLDTNRVNDINDSINAGVNGHAGPADAATGDIDTDEATLPEELLEIIRLGAGNDDRSAVFHSVIAQLKKRHWSVEAIVRLLEKYPNGIAEKYLGRIREEVQRSYDKFVPGITATAAADGSSGTTAPGPSTTSPRVLRTIRVMAGQLPRILNETEDALLVTGMPIFSRAGSLVHPVVDSVQAANNRKTKLARLRPFCPDSMIDWISDAALFCRFDVKRSRWLDINPPRQVVTSLLAREWCWKFPHVGGIITTPTLRMDGSLLADPGYDPRSELYLLPGFGALIISEHPTREEAVAALNLLLELLSEFSFTDPVDRSIALAGLLTVLVRGSLMTAPMFLIRAHTPGTGKSYLVDIIAATATGRLCPVIAAAKSEEETDKRLGSLLLDGSPIISLDNCIRDLEGQLLCQLTERSIVKIRILGRSLMPDCECRSAVFATGNNIGFKGDMIRRGLTCNLDTGIERPELRSFQHNPLHRVIDDRKRYVAAAFTIIRAYQEAGFPQVCGPLGSYTDWSAMVRSPLVWLGQPDPIISMESSRDEDSELADIRELFGLWRDYLSLDDKYTTSDVIEIACRPLAPSDFNRQPFKELLLRVARERTGTDVSALRLSWWLRRISGRVVEGHRLGLGRLNKSLACYWLSKIGG